MCRFMPLHLQEILQKQQERRMAALKACLPHLGNRGSASGSRTQMDRATLGGPLQRLLSVISQQDAGISPSEFDFLGEPILSCPRLPLGVKCLSG